MLIGHQLSSQLRAHGQFRQKTGFARQDLQARFQFDDQFVLTLRKDKEWLIHDCFRKETRLQRDWHQRFNSTVRPECAVSAYCATAWTLRRRAIFNPLQVIRKAESHSIVSFDGKDGHPQGGFRGNSVFHRKFDLQRVRFEIGKEFLPFRRIALRSRRGTNVAKVNACYAQMDGLESIRRRTGFAYSAQVRNDEHRGLCRWLRARGRRISGSNSNGAGGRIPNSYNAGVSTPADKDCQREP